MVRVKIFWFERFFLNIIIKVLFIKYIINNFLLFFLFRKKCYVEGLGYESVYLYYLVGSILVGFFYIFVVVFVFRFLYGSGFFCISKIIRREDLIKWEKMFFRYLIVWLWGKLKLLVYMGFLSIVIFRIKVYRYCVYKKFVLIWGLFKYLVREMKVIYIGINRK